ncbi:glycosyltransferase family 9 protein [Verrucomicrobium spinosum]|uniref:glycosyltransferase family 9 protein n=1 Tax=Verrucomicrobium spinosum TaxID=2736 RepID=UPI0009466C81|nr:glycosyltransferase family 9 protein [Verrucomicrobium spinosum]
MSSARYLLIQLKRIGDFILTAPAVQALRAARPHAEIVLLVPMQVTALAECVPGVDRIIPYRSGRANLETWGSALAGEWEAVLDFTGTDRAALIVQLSRAVHRLGYAKFAGHRLRRMAYTHLSEASVRDLHTVDFHLALVNELLGQLGEHAPDPATHPEPGPALITAHALRESMRSRLADLGVPRDARYAIIHPGTAREEKFWLDDRWAEVAAHLHDGHGLHVLLTGSGDGLEKSHLARLKTALRTPVVDLTGSCSLLETAALIAGSQVIVGVDSMAMHLSALQHRPQVALFGPTNPFHWRARMSTLWCSLQLGSCLKRCSSPRLKGEKWLQFPPGRCFRRWIRLSLDYAEGGAMLNSLAPRRQ